MMNFIFIFNVAAFGLAVAYGWICRYSSGRCGRTADAGHEVRPTAVRRHTL